MSAPGLGVRSDSTDGPLQTGSSHTQLRSALHPKWAARKALGKQNTGMLNQLQKNQQRALCRVDRCSIVANLQS